MTGCRNPAIGSTREGTSPRLPTPGRQHTDSGIVPSKLSTTTAHLFFAGDAFAQFRKIKGNLRSRRIVHLCKRKVYDGIMPHIVVR
jgi:hypothetical protein